MSKDRNFGVRWALSVGMSGLLGACATPAAQAPLSASEPGARAATGDLAEVGNFADRGAPSGVGIWLRVPAPGRDIPLLGTLIGAGSMFDLQEVLSRKLGPALGRTVDLSKPIDLTTGLEEEATRIVLAAGIFDSGSFVSQVSKEFQVEHYRQGRWRLVPKEKPEPGVLECELWQAAKPIGARLVCATTADMIEEQGTFLMAAARSSVDRANFHAELPGKAARDLLQKGAEQDAQKHPDSSEDSDLRAGREMGHRLVTDWGNELSNISWDLTLRRDSVELSQEMGFLRADSLFSTALSGRDAAVSPVPEAFWRLPIDSDAALYSEGAEPERMRRHGAALMHELRRSMEADDEHDYPKVALDRMEGSLRGLLLRGGAFELAYGQDLDQASRALNEAAAHASDRGPRSGSADPALKKAEAQLGGWAVLGIEDDSRAYLQALREALRYASDKTKYPRKKGAKAKPSPPSPSTYELREIPVPASAGLPADALHFVLRSQPNPKYVASKAKPAAPPPGTIHVLAIADSAQHAWIALSADEAQVLARIQALLSPVSAKTLGASDELRQFEKQQRVAGLGFGTLAGFSALGLSAESKPKVLESRNTLKQLWSLPKRGATRMPIWITRAQSAKGSRRVTLHLRLTPDAIGDVLALFIGQSAE